MELDWDELRRLQEERLLSITEHSSGKYWLLNYAPKAQYENVWEAHPTLLDCRGAIVRADGMVIAKPFRKFFNVGERPETAMDVLATLGEPEITHKLDGSMITLWRDDDGAVRFATRGSFTSPQAQIAAEVWARDHAPRNPTLDDTTTYVFELVSPRNRIVVQYPDERLVLTGLVDTRDGREHGYEIVHRESAHYGYHVVEAEASTWHDLVAMERSNFEGFVLFWPHAQRRVKFKLAEYVRLHRIITGLSERTIWEILSVRGETETLRREIPEEMHVWFDRTANGLFADFLRQQGEVEGAMQALAQQGLTKPDRETRKQAAAVIVRDYLDVRGAVFRALDGKEYDSLLWRALEPKATPLFAGEDL